MPRLRMIEARPGYRLHVEYADGVAGEVDVSDLVGRGVFAAWRDVSFFEAVSIGEHGEPRWGETIDLCPDALYLDVTGKSAAELYPKVKAVADA